MRDSHQAVQLHLRPVHFGLALVRVTISNPFFQSWVHHHHLRLAGPAAWPVLVDPIDVTDELRRSDPFRQFCAGYFERDDVERLARGAGIRTEPTGGYSLCPLG